MTASAFRTTSAFSQDEGSTRMMATTEAKYAVQQAIDLAKSQGISALVECINDIRASIHAQSPFKSEPVDFVRWVAADMVSANDYNPNSVAPPEMELLRTSISADGYTQPIVGNEEDGRIVVVDGFHRHRVGKECGDINARISNYLPVVQIRSEQVSRDHRMASTVRHNRARGKHKVEAMSDMVIELKRRNWSDEKICRELGMDADEVLRLCQISGLSEIFSGQEFSKAWEAVGHVTPEDFADLSGDEADYADENVTVKTANTDDESRIFHTFDKWECAKAGFYETKPPKGMSGDDCRAAYRDMLADIPAFEAALAGLTLEWRHSCEHYLTNSAMNRIAWLGQAALCYRLGIPAEYRGGYGLLTEAQQLAADEAALRAMNAWMVRNNMPEVGMEAANPNRQADIY